MNVFVFDIETIPDVENGQKQLGLSGLGEAEVIQAMQADRREQVGHDFIGLPFQKIVCISAVFWQREKLKVWSLGNLDSDEKEIIHRFFQGIEKYTPTLVSWNGCRFDLPVLHYRALYHGLSAPRYWEMGESDTSFRYNNYLNRFHSRHLDLMDVLAGYQGSAVAKLDDIATLLGFPGKMGQSGAKVYEQYLAGDLEGIRNYCETDVLNTFLIYLRFELMRGNLNESHYHHQIAELKTLLQTEDKSHFTEFLAHLNA